MWLWEQPQFVLEAGKEINIKTTHIQQAEKSGNVNKLRLKCLSLGKKKKSDKQKTT